MMFSEFQTLTNSKVSYETYTNKIEPLYMESKLSKQDFCKQYTESNKKSKTQSNIISIELQRNNITLAQFLSACKLACKQKGINFDIDREEFENPVSTMNVLHFVKIEEGKKISCNDNYKTIDDLTGDEFYKSEIYKVKPLEYQTYFLTMDGNTCFNEICEFTFDDEKTGHGYYYRIEKNL